MTGHPLTLGTRCPVLQQISHARPPLHSALVFCAPRYIPYLSLTSNIVLIIYDRYLTGRTLGQPICVRCALRQVADFARGRHVWPASIGLRCFHTAQLLIILWLSLSDDRSLTMRTIEVSPAGVSRYKFARLGPTPYTLSVI